jgi:hypothetical protein
LPFIADMTAQSAQARAAAETPLVGRGGVEADSAVRASASAASSGTLD